ncbi:Krueppel homolog 1 isoform X1 [Orussus abietinus]|uniref:Krueppel homolog 1 isoform X1 n=1 Tax=Orussus abietinus TaxID=222816 RepID=UPI000625B3FC|nr:Krueppel homolog 1 isoform X1 [Orussus abietinus]XP_012279716.1 Krueppel homolog 1 isoform X1 [Orussus abietinus]XP_012279718.1 Krueppel homolog 1 isoform X1 [Orussus abietinus]XP_012279719.1 Krueppel homolog 1 isoform X1 [Orussus abietinus]XP_012279720.1 Krueppel homolog 1 isoform X1 [Orussus abietinus]
MSDGIDGGGGENEVDSHSSSHAEAGDSTSHREDDALDPDNEAALNTNYDSSDGAVPAFRCERCDNYETINKTAFCAHQDQCLIGGDAGEGTEGIEGVENDGDLEEGHSGHRSHRKMFECDVCNMKFSNGANMRRHKMRHTGVKPYECRVCQKRFFRKDHLAEHFTTHSKTLPYHCPICNRGFQRQIAMRAHFQNEHVGQHDMVKSCPLCNYRAATMKCLRLHFFNRHGIDLDNPGPNGSSSSVMNSCTPSEAMSSAPLSDSGDSTGNRSADNATPPMHFLTPHVEISIPYPEQAAGQGNSSPAPLNGDSPNSPQSADSNSNAPSSSHHHQLAINSTVVHRNVGGGEETITPSISLIPIKQEPNSNGLDENGATSSSLPLPSLIKVSPLKSLLRDDLRRKLSTSSNSSTGNNHSGGLNPGNNNNNNKSVNNNNTGNNNNNTSSCLNSSPHSRGEPPTSTRPDPRTTGLQCTHCRITFPDQTLYFLHKGCHSESNPWKCNICGEQCCNLYQFNSHLLSKSHQ